MTHLISRRLALAGFGTAVLLPRSSQAAEPVPPAAQSLDELVTAARREATLTWYVAQVDTETAEAMGRAFSTLYPGIRVAVIRTTGQVAYERLLQDLKNNAP